MNVNWKFVLLAGIAGGIWTLVAMFLFGAIANFIAPYNILELAGMRAIDDPVMALFFVYPFVFSFLAAIVFSLVHLSLGENTIWKGLTFGVILLLISTIPTIFMIFSSMVYPAGFYIENILTGVIGYPVLGIFFAGMWKAC